MPESEPIDRAAYAALVETVSDDTDFVAELVHTYALDALRLVTGMRAAAAADRAGDLAGLAHELKSSSASVGAAVLPVLCGNLEAQERASTLQDVAEQVQAIELEVVRVGQMLRALGRGV